MSYAPTQPGIDTSGVGVANAQSLTLFDAAPYEPSYSTEAHMDTDATNVAQDGNPTLPLLGILGGLVALGFIRSQSDHLKGNTIALNAFNFTMIIFTVMLGIALMKVVFTKYRVPGVTQLVHSI